MHIDFPGITATHDDDALIVHSDMPLHILSSAVVGGGFIETQTIINWHVAKNYDGSDPAADLDAFARERGIDGNFVGMLTAVWMRKARTLTLIDGDLRVTLVVTAGVRNATAAGISAPYSLGAGTINLILLVDGNLFRCDGQRHQNGDRSRNGGAYERGVYTPEGVTATGTSTDVVLIACTGRGKPLEYAGPVTPVGYRWRGRCGNASRRRSMRNKAAVLLLALLIDSWLGEPPTRWHPVVWMGSLISRSVAAHLRKGARFR